VHDYRQYIEPRANLIITNLLLRNLRCHLRTLMVHQLDIRWFLTLRNIFALASCSSSPRYEIYIFFCSGWGILVIYQYCITVICVRGTYRCYEVVTSSCQHYPFIFPSDVLILCLQSFVFNIFKFFLLILLLAIIKTFTTSFPMS